MLFRIDAGIDYRLTASKGISSILAALRKTFEVKEIWITREGGSTSKTYQDGVDTYNVFNFRDGREIIESLRPDLIMLNSDYEYLTRSILRAGTAFKVPVVIMISAFPFWVEEDASINEMLTGRAHILRTRGKSIVRRYFFLLRTLVRSHYNLFFLVKTIIKDIYVPLNSYEPTYKFGGGDLNLVSAPEWISTLEKNGIDKNKTAVVGDWNMDLVYDKIADLEKHIRKSDVQEVLFVTTAMVEHGYWSTSMRDEVVTEVIAGLQKEFGKKIKLKLKIHPVSESLDEYRKVVDTVDPSIEVIQRSELLPLINQSDSIVTFGESWALFEALLLNKPIFIMNIFNEDASKNPYLSNGVAIECRDMEELLANLKDIGHISVDSAKLDFFLKRSIYKFDGKCGERAAAQILSLLKSQKKP